MLTSRNASLLCTLAVSMLVCAGEAQAQAIEHFNVEDVEFVVTNCAYSGAGKVQLVVDGMDGDAYDAQQQGTVCTWTVSKVRKFNAGIAFVSVRFPGHRSDCQRAYDIDRTNRVAKYRFRWNELPARNVSLRVDPEEFPVSYVRVLPKGLENGDCIESALLHQDATEAVALAVRWPRERLTLKFASKLELPLDERTVLKERRDGKRYKKELNRDGVVQALAELRLANTTTAATTSGTARDLDYDALKALKTVTIVVE